MDNTKCFICLLVLLLLILITINIYVMKEKESFISEEDSNFIEDESKKEPVSDNSRISELQDVLKQLSQEKSKSNNIYNEQDKSAFINNQINDAIQKEKEEGEKLLKNDVKSELVVDSEDGLPHPLKTEEMKDIFEKLSNMEYMCNNIESRSKLKDNLEQIRINETALKELEEQERQINDLKKIVKQLRIQKERQDIINNQCRFSKQKMVNTDYKLVKNLANKGLLKNEAFNVNLKLGDLGNLLNSNSGNIIETYNSKVTNSNNNVHSNNANGIANANGNGNANANANANGNANANTKPKKCSTCPNIDKTKMIPISKLDNNVCLGCSAKVLNQKHIKNL